MRPDSSLPTGPIPVPDEPVARAPEFVDLDAATRTARTQSGSARRRRER